MSIFLMSISAMALLVSAYTLWSTKLSKFQLEVACTSRVALTANPKSPGARQPGVILDLLFTNKGARLGYVADVALSVRQGDSQSAALLFRSLFEEIEQPLNFTNQLPPPQLVPFASFPVKGGETVMKKIWFVPLDASAETAFQQGKYVLVPHTREAGPSNGWKEWESIELDIEQEDVRALSQTAVTLDDRGGQFVKLITHSKPTKHAEYSLRVLRAKVETSNRQAKE